MKHKQYLTNSYRTLMWIILLASFTLHLKGELAVAPAAWHSQQSWWPADVESAPADLTVSEANSKQFLGEGWLISNRIAGLLSGHYSPKEGRIHPVSLTMVDSGNLVIYLGTLETSSAVETNWLVATRSDIPAANDLGVNYMTGGADFQNLTSLGQQVPLSALNVTPNNQAWQRVSFTSSTQIPANSHLYLRLEATGLDPHDAQTLIQDFHVGLTSTPEQYTVAAAAPPAPRPVAAPQQPTTGPLNAQLDGDIFGFVGLPVWMNGTLATGNGLTYHWDYGDGNTGTGQFSEHIYAKAGTYTVTLTVTDAAGQSSTATQTATISPPPSSDAMPYRANLLNYNDPTNHYYFPWDQNEVWSAENRYYDLDGWKAVIDRLAEQGYNVVVVMSDHPFSNLMKIPGFPEAQTLDDETLQRNQDVLKAVIAYAKGYGIRVDMLVYNIWLPETFPEVHGVDSGQDTGIARDYTATCVEHFYKTFPNFGSFVLTVGENGHPIEFCRATYSDVLEQMDPQPDLVIRDQNLFPSEIKYIGEGINEWSTLVKISEEQYLGDLLGPRGQLMMRSTGRPVVYLVSWYPVDLFQCDTNALGHMVNEARKAGGAGFIVSGGGDSLWLFQKAFGYFMSQPAAETTDQVFIDLIKERYGDTVPAESFLLSAQKAGKLLPLIHQQYYGRNWGYMAKYGLMFDSMFEMRTFPQFLRPGGEPERLFYDWLPRHYRSEFEFQSVQEMVAGQRGPATGKELRNPETLRTSLYEVVDKLGKLIPELSAATPTRNAEKWQRDVLDLRIQHSLSLFYADKITASIAWENWKQGQVSAEVARTEVDNHLNSSIEAYRNMTELFQKRFGNYGPSRGIRMVASGDSSHWNYHGRRATDVLELLDAFIWERREVLKRMDRDIKSVPSWPEYVPGPTIVFSEPSKHHYVLDVGKVGDGHLLTGFNDIESGTSNSYRWSKELATITLPKPAGFSPRVAITLHAPDHAIDSDSGIYYAGEKIAAITAGDQTLNFTLPTDAPDPTILELRVKSWKPMEVLNINDPRVLGVQLQYIKVETNLAVPDRRFDANRGVWQIISQPQPIEATNGEKVIINWNGVNSKWRITPGGPNNEWSIQRSDTQGNYADGYIFFENPTGWPVGHTITSKVQITGPNREVLGGIVLSGDDFLNNGFGDNRGGFNTIDVGLSPEPLPRAITGHADSKGTYVDFIEAYMDKGITAQHLQEGAYVGLYRRTENMVDYLLSLDGGLTYHHLLTREIKGEGLPDDFGSWVGFRMMDRGGDGVSASQSTFSDLNIQAGSPPWVEAE